VTRFIAASLLCGVSLVAKKSTTACPSGGWSPVVSVVNSVGQPIYVERPRAINTRGGVALIGSHSYLWATRDLFSGAASSGGQASHNAIELAGAVLGPNGVSAPVPLPKGVGYLMSAHVVAGRSGSITVYWASTTDSFPDRAAAGNEVWRAGFDGTKWRSLERVYAAKSIFWTDEAASVTAGPTGDEIAAGAFTSGADAKEGVVYLRQVDSEWRSSWVDTGTLPPFDVTSSIVDARARLIVFSGSVHEPNRQPRRGIFFARSDDAGASWSAPQLIRAATGDTVGAGPTIIEQRSGDLHLLWLDRVRPGTKGSLIRHFVSKDHAKTWTSLPELVIAGGTDVFRATAVTDEEFLVVARDPGTHLIELSSWQHGRWSTLTMPFAQPSFSVPTVSVAKPGGIYVAWGVGRVGALPQSPNTPAPALVYSSRPASCVDEPCCSRNPKH
jgi:hypothetical protein